jgi:hypothetical protein
VDVGENGAGGGLPEFALLSGLGGDGDLGKTKAGRLAATLLSEELPPA